MVCFRVLFFGASLIGLAFWGYWHFNAQSPMDLGQAYECLFLGKPQEGVRLLEQMGDQISFKEKQLYKAYAARHEGKLEMSDRYLAIGTDAAVDADSFAVALEFSLNQMLNAYLQKDPIALHTHIIRTQRLVGNDSGWVALFSALEASINHDYDTAVEMIQKADTRNYVSPWMEKVFQYYFPASWEEQFTVRCEIARGNGSKMRPRLEEITAAQDLENQDENYFLLGLCCVKEGESCSFEDAIPFYREGFRYFDEVSITEERRQPEREQIASGIRTRVDAALRAKAYDALYFYADLLETWGDCRETDRLVRVYLRSFLADLAAKEEEYLPGYALVLSRLLEDRIAKEELESRTVTALEVAFEEGDWRLVEALWSAARWLSSDPGQLTSYYADRAARMILLGIPNDDSGLSATLPCLNFWNQLVDDPSERYEFAMQLVGLATELWPRAQDRDKTVLLMQLAQRYSVSAHQHFVRKQVERRLNELAHAAIYHEDVAELHDLRKAVATLKLSEVELKPSQDENALVREAVKLYKAGRYEEAQKKAEWVLEVDADNVDAKILLMKLAYQQFAYEKALEYQKGISSEDPEVIAIQGMVLILMGHDEEGKQLLEKVGTLDAEAYLRLAFGLLAQNKPLEAMEWLDHVEAQGEVVLAGRCVIAFQMQSWSEAVEIVKELDFPYNVLDGFQGIAVESLMAMDDVEEAEEVLTHLVLSPPEPEDLSLPDYFQVFKQEKLDQWNRYYVAARFYHQVKDETRTALFYLEKIEQPTLLTEITRAELLMDLGRQEEARKVLLRIEAVRPSEQVKAQLLPLLGAVHAKLGYFAEAWSYYSAFQKLKPEDSTYRAGYARVLMRLRRFDLAFEQFRQLYAAFPLRPADMLAYIQCMIHTDRFDLANKTAWSAFKARGASLDFRLALARLMVITNNKGLIQKVLQGLAEQQKRPIEVEEQLIRFWAQTANYGEALPLARFRERELIERESGLKILMNLYSQQSQFDKALFFAEQAAELLNPFDHDVAEFMGRYSRNAEEIVEAVKDKEEKLEEMPTSATLRIGLATDLIDQAIAAYSSDAITDIQQSPELHEASMLLLEVMEQWPGLPEAYYLLGKVYYLLGKEDKAQEAYQTALRLDVSYIVVYQHSALIYEGEGEREKAIKLLRKAATFEPNNASLWGQLGALYTAEERYADAAGALQQAIRFTPNEPDAYTRMADALLHQDDPLEAIAYLEQALDLSPRDMEAVKQMLVALHHPKYVSSETDSASLKRRQLLFFDKLEAIDPKEADAMRARFQ